MRRIRVGPLAGVIAAGAILVNAATASASSIQVVNGSAVFTAAPGEVNDVLVGGSRTIVDNGAALTAGPGCQQLDAHSARCPDDPHAPLPLIVHAGDGNDKVDVDFNGAREITVYGEDGRDTIHVGSEVGASPLLDGGRGDDDLSTNNNGSAAPVLRGGPGNDKLQIAELGGGLADGGSGNDRILYTAFNLNSPLRLDGGDGNDTYGFGIDFHPNAMVPSAGFDTLDQSLVPSSFGITFDMADCPGCVQRVIGSANDDTITGDGHAQEIFGGGGDDTLAGGGGPDLISGQGGDDTIEAHDGAIDGVLCGAGSDSVTADRFDLVGRSCELVSRLRAGV